MPEHEKKKNAATHYCEQKAERARDALARYFPAFTVNYSIRRLVQEDCKRKAQRCKRYARVYAQLTRRRFRSHGFRRRAGQAVLLVAAIALLSAWYSDLADSNVVIAIFTVVMAWTTWLNWVAMANQNEIMHRQSEQTDEMIRHMRTEQRPWLCPREFHLANPITVGFPVAVGMCLLNGGKTPAMVVRHIADGRLLTSLAEAQSLVRKLKQDLRETGSCVIAPQVPNQLGLCTPRPIEPNEVDALNKRTLKLFVFGLVTYTSIGDGQHFYTSYLVEFHPYSREFPSAGGPEENYMT